MTRMVAPPATVPAGIRLVGNRDPHERVFFVRHSHLHPARWLWQSPRSSSLPGLLKGAIEHAISVIIHSARALNLLLRSTHKTLPFPWPSRTAINIVLR